MLDFMCGWMMSPKRAAAIYILKGHSELGVTINGRTVRWNQYEDAGWMEWNLAYNYLLKHPVYFWFANTAYKLLSRWYDEQ